MPDHLIVNKPQELLAKIEVQIGIARQPAQASDLCILAAQVGGGRPTVAL